MDGRAYFGFSCSEERYNPADYVNLRLIGRKLSWTTDLSGSGCGCNAAFYLTSMSQNFQKGRCNGDYYCDAMSVCGVACFEIDLQEANLYSWMTTLHTFNEQYGADPVGQGVGYGGSKGEAERRDWTSAEYAPGAKCIDTTQPFQASVSFP